MSKRLAVFALAPLLACSHSTGDGADAPPGAADAPTARRPNIVFILTDDLDDGVYAQMPRLHAALDDQGTAFREHFLNISLCCPSRTAILRGQYAHNTRIFGNSPPAGGFETFYADGSEAQTMAVWLQQASYRTVLMGKYLNGYPNTAPAAYVPPGWSEWYSPVAGNPYAEFDYSLDENGTIVPYGTAPADYLVDVLAARATDFIHRAAEAHVPFFMYVAPYAPHAPATPAPRYANDFALARAPRTPSWNEADVGDKPAWVQALPVLDQTQIGDLDALYRKRLQSMEAVEDLVDGVVAELDRDGVLDDTYIVFTSDNGFHQGQHRLVSGKNTEFDEDLRVPMIVRGPGVAAGRTIDQATVNVDFAPTFLDWAGVPIPDGVDGRSFAPLAAGGAPATWRQSVLLEHAADLQPTASLRQAPAGTLEPADQLITPAAGADYSPPAFQGVRTARYTYVEYATGERELYDHVTDPDQLTNVAATADPAVIAQLHAALHGFDHCAGASCRAAEEVDAP